MLLHNPTSSYLSKLDNKDAIQKEWRSICEENARKFLKDVENDIRLRNKFKPVRNPDEFIKIATKLGYSFTTEDILTVVKEQSQGATERRDGIWQWLRSINWIEKDKIHNPPITFLYKAEQVEKFLHLQADVELLSQQMLDLKHKSLVELDQILAG